MLPLGAAGLLILGFLMSLVCSMIASYMGESPAWLVPFGITGVLLFLLGMLMGLCVPLWLLVMTVLQLKQGLVKRVLLCWGSSAIAAVMALGVACASLLQMLSGGPDYYASGLTVPADKEFVLPRDMTFFCNMDIPPRVEELRALRPNLPEIACRSVETDGAEELSAPNLMKLSGEAPELLQEYMLRALYAEATNPRFNSPVLPADASIYLAHKNDPQTHVLRSYLAEIKIYSSSGVSTAADYPSARWQYPLQNGWFVAHAVGTWYEEPSRHRVLLEELRRLDAALAPLAENPTRENLDSLLPPTPEHPFLCLWENSPGCYDVMMLIPFDYEAGSFELRAHESSTHKPVAFSKRWRPEVKLGEVCRVISSDGSLMVSSGNWGEYYGSEWEIWFTPASGGEARCVSRQSFLMMGWQH